MSRFLIVVIAMLITLRAAAQSACPCCTDNHRQFDFWIGEWAVYNPAGTLAGENRIEVVQDSCIIRETWTSLNSKFTGTSYNFFNTQTGKWQQLWVDNQGSHLELKGGLVGNEMILSTDAIRNTKGELQIDRITWTPLPGGMIRQRWEKSVDAGKIWTTLFDGTYKRKSDVR
ncbi:MAG TPA: hypothetical protein VEB86_11005 [Chryseosolibacter sp.]|nr:hypothetical protein [Chryseosolibacter sp.]